MKRFLLSLAAISVLSTSLFAAKQITSVAEFKKLDYQMSQITNVAEFKKLDYELYK